MKNMIRNFFNDETGLELSEYAVGAALIAIAAAAAFSALGHRNYSKNRRAGSTKMTP